MAKAELLTEGRGVPSGIWRGTEETALPSLAPFFSVEKGSKYRSLRVKWQPRVTQLIHEWKENCTQVDCNMCFWQRTQCTSTAKNLMGKRKLVWLPGGL